tara:strand:- start:46 stop:573 length:528 start_codon:yes stop_codon:yes gene_type:complete
MENIDVDTYVDRTTTNNTRPPLMPRIFNCDSCNLKYRTGSLREYLIHKLEENDMVIVEEQQKIVSSDNVVDNVINTGGQRQEIINGMVDDDIDDDEELIDLNQGGGFVPIILQPNNRRKPKPKPKPKPVPTISFDIFAELKKFNDLLINGIITQEQFDTANVLLFDKYRNDILSL